MFGLMRLLRIFHPVLLNHLMLHLLIYYLLLFWLVQHSSLLALPLITVLYPRLHYYPRRSLLVMLMYRYYAMLFVSHLYLCYHLVLYLVSRALLVLLFLILGLTRLLRIFHLELLIRLMLHLLISYLLLFLLVLHLSLLGLLLITVPYP